MVADDSGRHNLSDEDIQRIVGYTAGRWKASGYDPEDLRSIANEAVAVTILKYDPDRVPESHMGAHVVYFARLRMAGMMKSYRYQRKFFWQGGTGSNARAEESINSDGEVAQKYLASLEESERVLLQLRMDGYTFEEIAELLGVTRQAVHERLRTIRRRLSKIPKWQALNREHRRGVLT